VKLKIISGGQTGVDRAALDAAIALGIPHGGWCPARRRAEDGRIPDRYNLFETMDHGYQTRTVRNVRDSHGTLVITGTPEVTPGSWVTICHARKLKRPCLHVPLTGDETLVLHVCTWIRMEKLERLNIAGTRESKCPGIYEVSKAFLLDVLRGLVEPFQEEP